MDRIERVRKAIEEFLKNNKFTSIEEANAMLDEFLWNLNRATVDEFCGLTPYHMRALIYHPFTSPEVVRFNLEASPPVDAPFLKLLLMLLVEIGNEHKGLKATAKGNLPRALCRRIDEQFYSEEARKSLLRELHPVMKEEDFWELHVVRVVAEMAGFIKKYKNRFILTRRSKNIVERGFTIQDFLHLLQTYTRKFNWAYSDRFEEFPIMQESFLFTLYLFHLYGDEYRPQAFYSDLFLKAYPQLLTEVKSVYLEPEKEIKFVYGVRVLERFAIAFGFAQKEEKDYFMHRFKEKIKKTSFLDEFVRFQVDN